MSYGANIYISTYLYFVEKQTSCFLVGAGEEGHQSGRFRPSRQGKSIHLVAWCCFHCKPWLILYPDFSLLEICLCLRHLFMSVGPVYPLHLRGKPKVKFLTFHFKVAKVITSHSLNSC
jgi:hypothetical protein